MFNKIRVSAGFAVGVFVIALSGNAQAQQWYNNTQQAAPATQSAKPAEKASDWEYTVGIGAGYAPTYEGSDEYDALVVPVLGVEYKDGLFFGNVRNGIGSYPLRGENYKIGASIGYAGGRDESDDRKNLRGMGDVDASPTANLLAAYNFGMAELSGKISTAVSGDYGTTADVKLGSRYPISAKVILSGSVGTVWADEEHMSNHFGVSSLQSARSGYRRYDAESGIKSVGVAVGATYRFTENWNTNLTLKGDQLIGDAADSPVVKDDFVPAVFLTTSYKF
jgi:outer membrane scaffolding protein for murein synthesis (MipA/OmpV family)